MQIRYKKHIYFDKIFLKTPQQNLLILLNASKHFSINNNNKKTTKTDNNFYNILNKRLIKDKYTTNYIAIQLKAPHGLSHGPWSVVRGQQLILTTQSACKWSKPRPSDIWSVLVLNKSLPTYVTIQCHNSCQERNCQL